MPFDWKPQDFKSVVKYVPSAADEPLTEMVSAISQKGFLSCPPPPWDPDGIYRVGVEDGRPQVQHFGTDEAWAPTRLNGPSLSGREKHQKFGILDAPNLLAKDLLDAVGVLGCTVLYLDADHFKALNSKFTERVVDRDLLPELHRLVDSVTRGHGYAYAEGGDEMVVLLRNCNESMGLAFAETLRAAVAGRTFVVGGTPVRMSVSIGVASTPQNDRATLADRANIAKAAAKRGGRNTVFIARNEGCFHASARLPEIIAGPSAAPLPVPARLPSPSPSPSPSPTASGVRPWRGAFR